MTRSTTPSGIPAHWEGSPLSRLHEFARQAQSIPTIVVGVSGSHASAAALRWAADETERRHGQLKVVVSWSQDQRAYYALPAQLEDPQRRRDKAGRDLDATMRTVLGPGPRGDTTTEVVEGTAERALVDRSAGADLLVLGSASGITAGRAIGPVIRTCLSRAHCPVVVVSPENFPCRDPEQLSDYPGQSYDDQFLLAAGAVPLPRPGD